MDIVVEYTYFFTNREFENLDDGEIDCPRIDIAKSLCGTFWEINDRYIIIEKSILQKEYKTPMAAFRAISKLNF
jgi:hypothetical protein